MQVTLFISAVTNEFAEDARRVPERVRGAGDYRTYLRDKLTCPDVCVKVQEDFIAGGVLTLDKLVLYIKQCDAVIHLVGDMTGAAASPQSVESLFASEPDVAAALLFAPTAEDAIAVGLSYTQWEAYLAAHFAKRLVVCTAEPGAPRAGNYVADDAQKMSQAAHLERLKALKRYPEISFASREELVIEVLRMLRTVLPDAQRESLPAPPCRLPYTPLGELFVGRDAFIANLRDRVEHARRSGRWPRHVVHGLGGMGKTRLAVEYAWRFRDRYDAVVLVDGESRAALDRDLASLTGVFHIDCDSAAPEPERTKLAVEWLRAHPGWLLVVDNVDTEEARDAVIARLPEWVDGHVLITARVADWPRDLEVLGLHVLEPSDAARFLLDATDGRRAPRSDDAAQAQALANDELGALCLALEQAAAFIGKLQISFEEYRKRWATNAKGVRARADKALMRYHEEKDVSLSVATTWQTTVDQLTPAAHGVLELLSWLAPDTIPMDVVECDAMTAQLQSLTGRADDDPELALAELRSFSLLSRGVGSAVESAGQLQRLVQLITRDSLSAERRQSTLTAALAVFDGYLQSDEIFGPIVDVLAPHVFALVEHATTAGISEHLAAMLRAQGSLLDRRARFDEEEAAYRRALAIDVALLPAGDPTIASDLRDIAGCCMLNGRLAEAEDCFVRAFEIDFRHFGEDHPRIGLDLSGWAGVLQAQGKHEDAEPLIMYALKLNLEHFGAGAWVLADNFADLGWHYFNNDQLEKAEEMLRRAVALQEGHYGVDSDHTRALLGQLAMVLGEKGEVAEAESLFRREIAIEERRRPDSPVLGICLHGYGKFLMETGRLSEAEPLLRRALELTEKGFGAAHVGVAHALKDLGTVLWKMGRFPEAESVFRRAVELNRHRTGDEPNPELEARLGDLAAALHDGGQIADAVPVLQEALEICERTLGPESSRVRRHSAVLGSWFRELGRWKEGEPLLRRAIELGEKEFGPDDKRVAAPLAELARVLFHTKRVDEAEAPMRRALEVYEKDPEERNTLAVVTLDLFQIVDVLDKSDEALALLRRALPLWEEQQGAGGRTVAYICGQVGWRLHRTGQLAEAEPLLTRALAIDEQVFGERSIGLLLDLVRLGELYVSMGRTDEARTIAARAKRVAANLDPDKPKPAAWLIRELAVLEDITRAEPWAQA